MAIKYKAVPKKNPLDLAQPAHQKAIGEFPPGQSLSENTKRIYLQIDRTQTTTLPRITFKGHVTFYNCLTGNKTVPAEQMQKRKVGNGVY
ncbi:MAG: hypothetical protein EOM23_12335, partial [Candidatus Moranbacteria bacterium]|nr:hypothetical protein [Candidatus Moranbacteria bacterium]